MFDITGKPVRRSRTLEASSLGAAICAAVGAGWYATAAEEAMSDKTLRDMQPSTQNRVRYSELLGIYRELYPNLCGTFSKLAHFMDGQ